MTREDWASGRIDHDATGTAKGIMGLAVFWNAISFPAAYGAITQEFIGNGKKEALIALIFPVIGLFIIWGAIYAWMQAKRFGKSRFVMERLPGTIGTVMRGIIVTGVDRALASSVPFTVKLTCYRRYVSGSGKNRRTSYANMWMDEKQFKAIARRDQPDHLAVPIEFAIPSDCQQTTLENKDNRILWKLEAKAAVPGVDYSSEFEIPVFRTPESPPAGDPVISEEPANDAFVASEIAAPEFARAAALSRGIRYQSLTSGGAEFRFAPMRNVGPVIGLTVMNVLCGASIWFMSTKGAPIFMPIIFGFFQLLLIYGLFTMTTSVAKITAARHAIRFVRGPFGFGKLKSVNADQVKKITISSGMQSGNTHYWDLKLQTNDNERHTLVTSIKDRKEAEWIAKTIAAAAGLPEEIVSVGKSMRAS